jgi:hypothetical protein
MKNKFFILLFAGLLMASCNEDATLNAPLNEDEVIDMEQVLTPDFINPHLKGEAVTRPMKVKGSGDIQYGPFCDEVSIFVQISGDGTATHLGKFDLYLTYCRNFVPVEPGNKPEGYQIAANGDKLLTRMLYDGVEDEKYFQVYEYYPGGTGRFEEAEGEVKLFFEFTYNDDGAPVAYSNYGEGELTF